MIKINYQMNVFIFLKKINLDVLLYNVLFYTKKEKKNKKCEHKRI